jgi:predicted nucleic acid-binding protein
MIVVDTNVILLVLTRPSEPESLWMHEQARRLFDAAAKGEVRLQAPTAVIAEVIFVLTSSKGYRLEPATAIDLLEPFVQIEGFDIELKPQVQRALALWRERPGQGFIDSLLVAIAEQPGAQLATFDTRLSRQARDMFPWNREATTE